jgi:hypothetical protein
MHDRRTFALSALVAVVVSLPLAAQWPATEKIDLDAIYRLKDEGLQRSKVMEIESYLTDVYGPRLTGSPSLKAAGEWAIKQMESWGLTTGHLEPWEWRRPATAADTDIVQPVIRSSAQRRKATTN